MSDIAERLNENIIADAFESRAIVDGALCERLIRERKEAADEILRLRAENEKLRTALKPFADIAPKYDPPEGDDDQLLYDTRHFPSIGMVRAAAAALKETDNA